MVMKQDENLRLRENCTGLESRVGELQEEKRKLINKCKNANRRLNRALETNKELLANEKSRGVAIDNFYSERQAVVDGSFASTESVAREEVALGENPDEPKPKGGVAGRSTRYYNGASNKAYLTLTGSKTARLDENGHPIGGVQVHPKVLLGKVMMFVRGGLISLRDIVSSTARNLSFIIEEVRVHASNYEGGVRRKWNTKKPLEVLGDISKDALLDGIDAFNLAIDKEVSTIMEEADCLFIALDSSTFSMYPMQSMYWQAGNIEQVGLDAAGNPLYESKSRSGFLNALPVENKGTVECEDQNGNELSFFAPEKFALQLESSGVGGVLLKHPCAIMGFDGGNEGCGSGSKEDTQSHSGVGGYMNEVFITRKAFDDARRGREGIIDKLRDFFGVSELDRALMEPRPAPYRLRTNRKVMKCGGFNGVSMHQNPLKYFVLIKGGVPRTRYCNKHRANLAFLSVMKIMMSYLKDLLSAVLFFRNVWVLAKLRPAIEAVFVLPESQRLQYHRDAAARIPPEVHAKARNRLLMLGFKLLKEAAKTRWATVQEGAVELHNRRTELVTGIPIGLGRGTEEARLDVLQAVFSQDGFRDVNKVAFSAKEGKNFWRMNDPAFRLGNMIVKFLQVLVWGPIMAASSKNKECSLRSMGGVGGVLRRILFLLQNTLFVRVPLLSLLPNPGKDAKIRKQNARRHLRNWYMENVAISKRVGKVEAKWLLSHRGTAINGHEEGWLMLNPHLGRERVVSELPSRSETGMKQLYGRFHTKGMDYIIDELSETMKELSKLKPGDGRNFLPKGLRELVDSPQDTVIDKQKAMLASVHLVVTKTVEAIYKYHERDLFDPHSYLAGIIGVESRRAINTRTGDECEFMVSTHEARANAGILKKLISELGHNMADQLRDGESLANYLTGPFGAFFGEQRLMQELDAFLKAENVQLPPDVSENSGLTGGMLLEKDRIYGTPQPFSVFPSLAKQAMIANVEPTNNNRVEGGFSFASQKWRAMMKAAKALMFSRIIRRRTEETAQLRDHVKTKEFLDTFQEARKFCWKNEKELKALWYLDLARGSTRALQRQYDELPAYVKNGGAFKKPSNIAPPDATKGKGRKPIEPASRQGGAKANKRYRNSSGSEYEDSDDETESLVEDSDDEDQALEEPGPAYDEPCDDSDQSHGQEGSGLPSLTSARLQRMQPSSVDEEPRARVHDDQSGASGMGEAPGPSQGQGQSEAAAVASVSDEDDITSGFDLDAMEVEINGASNVTSESAPQGSGASPVAVSPVVEPAPAANAPQNVDNAEEEAEYADVDLDELEQLAGCRKLLNGDPDSEVSESEDESHSNAVSKADLDRYAVIKAQNKPLSLNHIRALLIAEKWVDSKVEKSGSRSGKTKEGYRRLSSLNVTRGADGIVIPVRSNDGHMIHVFAEATGDELGYITDIFDCNGAAKIRYLPVHDTERAHALCDQDEDLIGTLDAEKGSSVRTRRIGKKSLRALLESRGNSLHHWGDVSWETRAENIVGLVGWLPLSNADDSNAKVAALSAMKSKGLVGIKTPDDLDWVIVGEQFSDRHPNNEPSEEEPTEISVGSSRRKKGARQTKAARLTTAPAASGDSPTPDCPPPHNRGFV